MKIGVNSRIYQNGETGIPYFIKNLFGKILEADTRNEYIFFQTSENKKLGTTLKFNLPSSLFWNALFDNFITVILSKKKSIKVFFGPSHVLPWIKFKDIRYVVTIHDLSFLVYPEHYSFLFRSYYYHSIKNSIKNADIVAADSISTKNDIKKFYGIDDSKVEVIPLGLSDFYDCKNAVYEAARIIDDPYILTISTHPKRKNIYGVLEALKKFKKIRQKIVIAGLITKDNLIELNKEIKRLNLEDRVILAGYVDEEKLKNLYSNADLFIYPSFYEGFGFPILESMACMTPVITSNVSSMPELMPQKEWLVDPLSVNEIGEKMSKILNLSQIDKNRMLEQNYEFCKKFNWTKTARMYMEIFERLK